MISHVRYEGDPHSYTKYKHSDNKYYVKCESRKVIAGVPYICKYKHKREDRHKALLAQKKIHTCQYEPNTEYNSNTLLDYYKPVSSKDVLKIDFTEEGLKYRLAILLGKLNISLDAGASDHMYDFITFCIAYGMSYTGKGSGTVIERARQAYPHFKNDTLRQAMLTAAKDLDTDMVNQFKQLDYVSISLDEGATFGERNLAFNLENPLSVLSPYTIKNLTMDDITATGYVTTILDGLAAIKLLGINIASCVCDGNKAQKKAFSYSWSESLRHLRNYPWIKDILFVPCLCHRIDNSYKHVVKHNSTIKTLTTNLREIGELCNEHQDDIKAKCPRFVNTRWIYDFEIVQFILQHKDKIEEFIDIPETTEQLYDNLLILKTLIKIFEDPDTPLYSAFSYLERALLSFQKRVERLYLFVRFEDIQPFFPYLRLHFRFGYHIVPVELLHFAVVQQCLYRLQAYLPVAQVVLPELFHFLIFR